LGFHGPPYYYKASLSGPALPSYSPRLCSPVSPPLVTVPPIQTEMDPDVELRGLDIDVELDPKDLQQSVPLKKVPGGDLFEAARAGDCDRLALLLEAGANVNERDHWDSVALYYACLAGHVEAAPMLLEAGAVCAERTFDGDRCHYAALNLRLRRLLKSFEARPPPLAPLPAALRATFFACPANRAAFLEMLQWSSGAEAAALAAAAGECCFTFFVNAGCTS
jgi:ankyrin repeat and BTB/POZ domain-containing protein 1